MIVTNLGCGIAAFSSGLGCVSRTLLRKLYQVAVVVAEYAFEYLDWSDRAAVYESPKSDSTDSESFGRIVHF